MMHWHLLASMCSTFMPARKYVRFLRFHLRRTVDDPDAIEEVPWNRVFIGTGLFSDPVSRTGV